MKAVRLVPGPRVDENGAARALVHRARIRAARVGTFRVGLPEGDSSLTAIDGEASEWGWVLVDVCACVCACVKRLPRGALELRVFRGVLNIFAK